jgi:hypothetical protein
LNNSSYYGTRIHHALNELTFSTDTLGGSKAVFMKHFAPHYGG